MSKEVCTLRCLVATQARTISSSVLVVHRRQIHQWNHNLVKLTMSSSSLGRLNASKPADKSFKYYEKLPPPKKKQLSSLGGKEHEMELNQQ